MGKKAVHLPTSEQKSGQPRKPDDKVIIDLIEKRKLQQEALTKIIFSMDAANEQNVYAAPLKRKNPKRLSK